MGVPPVSASTNTGGGVINTSRSSCGTLDTITGGPLPTTQPPTRLRPNPRPDSHPLLVLQRNSSAKSVIEVVHRKELLWLDAMIWGSQG